MLFCPSLPSNTSLNIQTLSHLIQSFPCPSSLLTPYREDFFNIYFLQTFYQSPLMPFCPCLPSKAPINTQNPCPSYTVLPLKCSIPIEWCSAALEPSHSLSCSPPAPRRLSPCSQHGRWSGVYIRLKIMYVYIIVYSDFSMPASLTLLLCSVYLP